MADTHARTWTELAAQHDALRAMMDRCEELADDLDAGRAGPLQLTREVARLRLAFDEHNRFEEHLLRPVPIYAGHAAEHRAVRGGLRASATAELRDAIAALRAHLEAEERYFGSAVISAMLDEARDDGEAPAGAAAE